MSPLLGCVADDYTGGTDVAAAYRRSGLRTLLFFGTPPSETTLPACDAVVMALKTRSVPPAEAITASREAQDWLTTQGARRLYFKYCSTFDSTDRGNIGPVTDALVEASGAGLTVVCPASPEHGRTLYQGHLFVGDRPLSESPMRHHPLTPMTDSDLVRVLSRQTPHPVALVPLQTVERGPAAVREALDDLAARGVRHAVTDAVTDGHLDTIARATTHLPVLTGAAGLARALATGDTAEAMPELPPGPSVILAGSCSAATLEQVAHARDHMPAHHLRARDGALPEALTWLEAHLGQENRVIVHTSAPPGQRSPAAAPFLERALAAVAARAAELGARRIVVAGGETSGAVVNALGVSGAVVGAEADRGVPWLLTTGRPPLALLLKSGNFGRPDLLLRATEAP
ncbi:four-carbon acid sugar kinase family protein [Nonomuraea sp. PA05]|uniref:3-oxo-tetronate kinase n=1 Tax=Nonomuraea sp. PA05 TaxID=2604466 RepID=UPI0011D8518C|nr:3-oxo-tetronate kinase [Nonomuraea sp. PA05]TYB56597.1 four-carbon acid sugar kinase family protein [Nonomuraea sp. PA05]